MNLIRLCKIDSNAIYFLENFVNLFLLYLDLNIFLFVIF